MHHGTDSEFLYHTNCESCGSSDANSVYDDGHTYCFSCGKLTSASKDQPKSRRSKVKNSKLLRGKHITLSARGLTEETCQKWGYEVGRYKGEPVQIANYYQDGAVVGQKVRTPDKEMWVNGKLKTLYGQWKWSKGRKLVVTEGEIDALSVSQAQQHKWPVVSIPNGAQGARKSLSKQMEWLAGFDEIILMFDQDEEGAKAVEECVSLFEPGRCKVASLSYKDANEALKNNDAKSIIQAIWNAQPHRPDGLMTLEEIEEKAKQPVEWGKAWPWASLTRLTYGRRPGEVYVLGAGTGAGKTDVFTQIIAQTVNGLGEAAGVFYLEQSPVETAKRVAGKVVGKRFHIPDAGWTEEDLTGAFDKLKASGRLHFYNHFGTTDWDVIKSRIRHLAVSEGVQHIFLDHLTALAAHADDERRFLDGLMEEIASLCQELQITMYVISHLTTPDGTPHEEGGRVQARHFRGSRAIMQWAFFMFGLERNQQAEDEVARQTTTFRILKDRYTGMATGQTFALHYDEETGMLVEQDAMSEAEDFGFRSEDDDDEEVPF